MRNERQLGNSRRVLMVAAGCISGIVGLTGFRAGALAFVLMQTLVTLSQFILSMRGHIDTYLTVDVKTFFFRSVMAEALTYILFWAFSYALVWIY